MAPATAEATPRSPGRGFPAGITPARVANPMNVTRCWIEGSCLSPTSVQAARQLPAAGVVPVRLPAQDHGQAPAI